MDDHLTSEAQNATIEDALHTYPLAPMPRDMTASVMARLQPASVSRPFRLVWTDFVIALALSLCIGAFWFSATHFPPLLLVQLRMYNILFYQNFLVTARGLNPAIFFGLAAFLSALSIPYLRQSLLAK